MFFELFVGSVSFFYLAELYLKSRKGALPCPSPPDNEPLDATRHTAPAAPQTTCRDIDSGCRFSVEWLVGCLVGHVCACVRLCMCFQSAECCYLCSLLSRVVGSD